ncbi:MAG: 4-(cytidine 5'-diphospho)-2-C-methyl-D-erythritol kinase [Planktomarina sp.]
MTFDPGFAPAKVNLTLHVTGQRADGYHLLDSLVVFADIGDHVTVSSSDTLSLTVEGPMAKGVPTDTSNLVLKAAQFLAVDQAQITLQKNLPSASGIGGGSSDAAAALRMLLPYANVQHIGDVATLGADVPVCMKPTPQRMSGVGDILHKGPNLPPMPAVLVNPGVHNPTPEVFKALTNKTNAPMPATLPNCKTVTDVTAFLKTCRNDLLEPAVSLAPSIADVLQAIRATGAEYVQMSGSGATCFGIYKDDGAAQRAAAMLDAPGWWVAQTVLNP